MPQLAMEVDRRLTQKILVQLTIVGIGLLADIFIGYALKKVVKLIEIVIGLFFVGIAYLVLWHLLDRYHFT